MYELKPTGQYKKDIKLCDKSNFDLSLMATALATLQKTGTLPIDKYKTHKLSGTKDEIWDSHIEPDWILLWGIVESKSTEYDGKIVLIRTGTHSNLFGKQNRF